MHLVLHRDTNARFGDGADALFHRALETSKAPARTQAADHPTRARCGAILRLVHPLETVVGISPVAAHRTTGRPRRIVAASAHGTTGRPWRIVADRLDPRWRPEPCRTSASPIEQVPHG